MTQPCEVFRREDDIEVMHEFTSWLRNGGMQSLRDMKQCSDEYHAIKKAGFSAMIRIFWAGVVFVIGLGAYTLFSHKR